jgi:putative pyruvate formate lyase activating enzyme
MPGYKSLEESAWVEKIEFFKNKFSPCNLCPNKCHARRGDGQKGACKAGKKVKVASFNLHHGEEPPISWKNGSGTIFFSGCTLSCLFCQNYPISQLYNGKYYSIEGLASLFLNLQRRGAHNINLVSPTPYLFHIIEALYYANQRGLKIPIVYNTSGYELPGIVEGLKGIVDIYLPDLKYVSDETCTELSGGKEYFKNAYKSIEMMFNQVGRLRVGKNGIGYRGLIIRHLILPGHIENSKMVLKAISTSIFRNSFLSLMSQYFPAYKALKNNDINRRIDIEEYNEVKEYAVSLGFKKGWFQDMD